jgi:hypothetical protein
MLAPLIDDGMLLAGRPVVLLLGYVLLLDQFGLVLLPYGDTLP